MKDLENQSEHTESPIVDIPDDLTLEDEVPLAPKIELDDVAEPEFGNLDEPESVEYVETKIQSTLEKPKDTRVALKRTIQTDGLPPISLLYGTLESTVAVLNKQSGNEEIADSRNALRWQESVEDAHDNYYRTASGRSPFEETISQPGHVWGQGFERNDVTFGPRSQRLPVKTGELLTGADAVARVTSAVGMGAIIQFPCYHSGIWISVTAPADVELYELERRIAMEKVSLGRMTKGLVFSNTSVYLAGHLINFILSHVYSTNAPSDDPATLKKILRVQDLPTLIWGMVTAIYPGGYPYRQPCVADVSKCTHVVEALLDIAKLQWVDRSMLSDEQRDMLVQRNTRVTMQDIEKYQADFARRASVAVTRLNDELVIELESPSLETYENSGYGWVETIVRATDEQFGSALTGKERSDYITDIARTTAPRQYSHWVKAIEVTDKRGITTRIVDRMSIEQSMVRIASVDAVKREFIRVVGKFIDATTICVIGYLNYACPKCGALQMEANGEKSRVVPIDMMQVFLTLQSHKIDQILKDINAI